MRKTVSQFRPQQCPSITFTHSSCEPVHHGSRLGTSLLQFRPYSMHSSVHLEGNHPLRKEKNPHGWRGRGWRKQLEHQFSQKMQASSLVPTFPFREDLKKILLSTQCCHAIVFRPPPSGEKDYFPLSKKPKK